MAKTAAKRVVGVTGVTSFATSKLLPLLDEDPTIKRIVTFGPDVPRVACAKVTHVYGGAHPPLDVLMSLDGTAVKAKRRITLSSTQVYGAFPLNPAYLDERCAPTEAEGLVLRCAPVIGPTVESWVTRMLGRRITPTVLGRNPLLQFLHEDDLANALHTALGSKVNGVFNVAGDGVVPLHTALRIASARALPLPFGPDTLRWPCVADNRRMKAWFTPAFTSHAALLDYAQTKNLRRIAA